MAMFKITRPDMKLELKMKGLNLAFWEFLQQFLNIREGMQTHQLSSKIVIHDDDDLECEGG